MSQIKTTSNDTENKWINDWPIPVAATVTGIFLAAFAAISIAYATGHTSLDAKSVTQMFTAVTIGGATSGAVTFGLIVREKFRNQKDPAQQKEREEQEMAENLLAIEQKKTKYVESIDEMLNKSPEYQKAEHLSTLLHAIVKQIPETKDPYHTIRKQLAKTNRKLMDNMTKLVRSEMIFWGNKDWMDYKALQNSKKNLATCHSTLRMVETIDISLNSETDENKSIVTNAKEAALILEYMILKKKD